MSRKLVNIGSIRDLHTPYYIHAEAVVVNCLELGFEEDIECMQHSEGFVSPDTRFALFDKDSDNGDIEIYMDDIEEWESRDGVIVSRFPDLIFSDLFMGRIKKYLECSISFTTNEEGSFILISIDDTDYAYSCKRPYDAVEKLVYFLFYKAFEKFKSISKF